MGPADAPCTLRVAAVLEGCDSVVQPLSARERHEAVIQSLYYGGGDLANDDTHRGDPHPEHLGDGAVLARPGEPPQRNGQSAARLDGDAVVRPAAFNGRTEHFDQVVERRSGYAKLRLPLLVVEGFSSGPKVVSGAPVSNPHRPVGGGDETEHRSNGGQHEGSPPPQIQPPPPVPLHLLPLPPPHQEGGLEPVQLQNLVPEHRRNVQA